MAAEERSRARDVFEGVIDQELDDNYRAISAGQEAFLTLQEEERLRAENNRACVDLSKLLPSELKKVVRLAVTPRFPTGCGKTVFEAVLTKIKELTDGAKEDPTAEFNKSVKIGKNENPRRFTERLENIVESLDNFHGVHKTEGKIIDQVLFAAEDHRVLGDTAK